MARNVDSALSFCDENNFKPVKVVLTNTNKGTLETLYLSTGEFQALKSNCNEVVSILHTAFNLKVKFSISHKGYHQLSMISDLPNFNQIKNVPHTYLNAHFDIHDAPEGVIGVQQKIKPHFHLFLTNMAKNRE